MDRPNKSNVFVVLLRAIGPLTHKVMSMALWRDAVATVGFGMPQTYIASGNMIVASPLGPEQVESEMNRIVSELGLGTTNAAVVRTPEQLRRLVEADPLPDAAALRPSQMGVYFFVAAKPDFGWIDSYDGHERIAASHDHLVIDYAGPVSDSVRLPGIIEKRSGMATARNWNTLVALAGKATARELEGR